MCLEDEADARVDGCNHLFCEGCISTWCYSHNQANCPTCRAGIAEIRCATTGDVLHKLTEGPKGQAGAALCADTLSHEAGAAFILKQRNMRESRTLKTTQSGAADSEMDNGSGIADAEDGDGGDVLNGSSAADTGADTDDPSHNRVEQLMALNSTGSSSKASVKASTSTTTTDVIAAAVAEALSSVKRKGLRSAGHCVGDADALPNEHAGLRAVSATVRNTVCRCKGCGYKCPFGLHLGRAHTFEHKQTTMWGASHFEAHPVADMLMQAAALLEEHKWGEIVIPFCDRDFLDNALRGSSMRAEEAAAHSWREACLDRTAAAAKMSAVELPFVEAAPLMSIAFANGTEDIPGVALAFLCLDRANVLEASAALRDLWAHNLTPGLMEGYDPIVLSEEVLLRVVANATINGDHCMPMAPGERQAAQRIEHEDMGLVVCQMDSATLDAVRVAARAAAAGSASAVEVAVMRDGLTRSAVSHLLAVRGGVLDGPAQEVARCSEAGAFKMKPDKVADHSFCRAGAAAGMFHEASVAERLTQHADVRERASRPWAEHMGFIAPSDTSRGCKSVAMRYIADEDGRARKRKRQGRGGSSDSTSMVGDSANQPRYVCLYPPVRGVELDAAALEQLSADEAYMQHVRKPQQSVAGRALLTLLHLNYGMEVLSAGQATNPFETSAVTWLRVCSEVETFDEACGYFAGGTRASVVLQPLAMHVDGVARRKRSRPGVEILTTRWSNLAHGWTDQERAAEMAAARCMQPYVAMSMWLRTSIALDVRPCRGLALVAVSAR